MNLQNQYWYFQKAVPDRICDEIIKYAVSIQDQMAVTGGYGDPTKLNQNQIKDLKKKRNSNIVWLSDRWVYKEIQPYVHQANASAGWNFEWDFSEACQFTKYNKGNIMIGIVTAGLEFITNLILLLMEKLENSQLLYPYVMEKNIKEETLK